MPKGIILKGIGGFYYVRSDNTVYECKAKGIFRKVEQTPLPGDEVIISIIDPEKGKGNIDELLPRCSHLIRPHVANINQILVIVSAKSPSPDLMLLDKLLITAEAKKIDAVICVNKIDLDEEQEYNGIIKTYSKAGYRVLPVSCKADIGFNELKSILNSRISVLAGQSGVGKSSILNKIMNTMVMETGVVSVKIERGKHTTRHAELVELNEGGFVLDTPGFSSFDLAEVPFNELENCFPEFRPFLKQCRFTGCSHIKEPTCAVKEGLEQMEVDPGRYHRFVTLYELLKNQKNYNKKK